MLRMINSGAVLLAQLQLRLSARQGQGKATTLKALGVTLTDEQAETVRRSKQALDNMTQANKARKDQRKAAARDKIERLKKQLQALRMMAVAGDPKSIARQAKRIAAELAAAAKEYAAAGGGGGGVSAGATATDMPSDADSTGGDATGSGATGSGAAADAKAVAATAAAEAKAGEVQAEEGQAKDGDKPAPGAGFQKIAADMAEKAATREADAKFADEVRRLFQEVRAILELQRRRARDMGQDEGELEQIDKEIAGAGADIDAALAPGGVEMFTPVSLEI